ncbi:MULTISPECIES: NADPH-dependent FMN reductase family protein [Haloferax]|uniref:Flavodoxin-like domain-containing protein n=1 Tax=Haloferax mediterranei (strain ATCC 33500 / DSM 1411 / JCM 8866 / NBRC 14739 / NCIMB 2177 / R-4) TaxID=523841 RepID=I3R804_HALMT|nr:flavodoxin domain-containing protein [Haloferax mediterranei]AFK20364.1 hypothetical protein HFX_2686 [Haloferax mediterranei ATCC 33500]ELZ99219.1 hypothetical protein C439_15209 [Haloferax mediterranei ATCC 33500]MDX5986881.1 flavodoxin domain-containing protein [Haloferax mediterranei ATCC 33500]
MDSLLIAYGTREGRTAKIADRIATLLEAGGHETVTISVDDGGDDASTETSG